MEAGEAVPLVLESGRRRGRPPKRRWRAQTDAVGGPGFFANDPIDVDGGVICVGVGNGVVDGARVGREMNVGKDVVSFRDNLGNGVGVLENEGFLVTVKSVGNCKGGLICDGKDVGLEVVNGEGRLEMRRVFREGINLNVTAEEEDVEEKDTATCNGHLDGISKGLGGGGFDLNSSIDLNEVLDTENECGQRLDFLGESTKRRRIDLNLEATTDMDENAGLYGKIGVIDLNIGPDCEAANNDDQAKVQESTLAPMVIKDESEGKVSWVEEKFVEVDVKYGKLEEVHYDDKELPQARVSVCISEDLCQDKDVSSEDPSCCERIRNSSVRAIEVAGDFNSSTQLENKSDRPSNARNNDILCDSESPCTIGSGCRRKRKSLDKANTVETVLRRSSRRGSLKHCDSNPIIATASCYVASSPAVSALSEEQPEEPILLPPKFQLPPSSQTFNLEGLPVMDVFSVHAFLRSFSLFLFLSPFKLEDFVFALQSESPNSLIDNIHLTLLMTLRRHLEHLSKEGSPSALTCLR
ncbi:hypothetical protein MLD38_004180 [Melastoma candidum]|nr:hypothetical protein MLD38_004180 [Melastoma candidum]